MELAVKRISLLVHHLCPYAQRALYTVAYKGLSPNIIEVSLADKPAILLSHSLLGKVPALIIETPDRTFSLCESKEVSEFLDSFPGPPLYPRRPDGSVCPLRKSLIDMHIKLTIDPIPPLLFLLITGKATAAEVQKARKMIVIIEERYVTDGRFFMHKVIGEDIVTLADIMLYPFAERIFAYEMGAMRSVLAKTETRNLKTWFNTMSELPWVRRYKAAPGRLLKIQEEYMTGKFKGLQLPLSRKLKIAKQFIPASTLVGLHYGVLYEMSNGVVTPADPGDFASFDGGEVVGDNRSLVDDNKAQALTAEEIKTMKDTHGGRKVIEELVNNSATFASKTQLSKEKYLKKKKAKHLCEFTLVKTTAFHMAETMFEQRKSLRPDVLANVITLSNLNFAAKVLVFEDYKGLLAGVCLQRSFQPITVLYTGEKAKLPFLQYFNLSAEEKSRVKTAKLEEVSGQFSSVIVCTNYHPRSTLEAILPFVQPAGQVVVHSYSAQFLAECEQWLIRAGRCIDVRIEEFMTRKYQVLPARTHPMMSSTGHGGYLLSCIAVAPLPPDVPTPSPPADSESKSDTKPDHDD